MAKILNELEFEMRVLEVYSMARAARLTSQQINERWKQNVLLEVLSATESGRRRYSNYMHGYVNGLRAMHTADLYRNHLEYLYLIDGVYYTTNRESKIFETVEKFYGTPEVTKLVNCPHHGHFWLGTARPYFIGS